MENYERTQELIEIASDSAGRSTQQFAKYADSVENKVNRLKNTWEQFRINLVDEKFYKSAINFANDFLSRFTKIDKFDMTAIITWGLTIGKNLIQGIIQSLKQGANGISSLIENIISRKKSGQTTIQIQTNLEQVRKDIDNVEHKLNELQNTHNNFIASIGSQKFSIVGYENFEAALNSIGYTLNNTRNDLTLLNFSEMSYAETTDFLAEKFNLTRLEAELLAQAIEKEKNQFQQNSTAIREQTSELDKLKAKQKEYSDTLKSSKNWQTVGSAIGSAVGTFAMMAFTGTFNAEEITKALAVQTLVAGINTVMSAATAAVAAGAGKMKVAFMEAGGPVAILLTALSTITLVAGPAVIKQFKQWTDSAYQAKQAYQEVVEQSKKLSEELDKQNKILEKLNEKWKNVHSAKNTFEELSQKIILTEEEQQDLNEATKTLAEQMPDLVSYYDAQGNAVIEINDRYREKIKLLKQEVIEQEKITALTNTQLQNSKYSEVVKGRNELEAILQKHKLGYAEDTNWSALNLKGYNYNQYTIPDLVKHFKDEHFLRYIEWSGFSKEYNYFREAMIKSLQQIGKETVSKENFVEIFSSLAEEQKEEIQKIFVENYLSILSEKEGFDKDLISYYSHFDQEKQEAINNQVESIQTQYQIAFKEALLKYDDSENKELIEGLLSNIYLTNNDIQSAYLQALKDSGKDTLSDQEMDNLLNQLIDIPEMQRVAQEVENLTPELAESVKEFYNQLSALSSEARVKIISDVGKVNSGALIEDMKKQDEEIQKRIKESRNKYLHLRGFEFTKGYIYGPNGHQAVTTANAPQALENAFEILQVRAESVFYDIEKKAEKIGGEAGDQYIIAMANAISSGKLTDAAITYLNNYDWESMDFIHMQTQISSMAAEMVKQEWVNTIEEGQKIIEKFIKEVKEENLGVVTEFKTVGDIEALQTTAENAFEILQNEMDNFTPVFRVGLEADEAKLTQEEYDKFTKAIRAIMNKKDSPWAGLFNISDYTGYDEKGQVYLKNLTKLRDILFGEQGPLAGMEQLNAEYERLQLSGTLTPDMNEAFQNLLEVFKNFGYYQKDFAKTAKEAVTTYRDIASSINSIASDYQSIADEQEENGFLSSKSLDSFLDGIKEINKQMEDTALEGQRLDVTSILSRNENGYEVNTAALKNYLITLIATAKASKDLQAEDSQLPLKLQAILDDLNAYEKKKLEEAQKKAEEERQKAEEERQKQLEELEKEAEDAKKAMEDAQKQAEQAQDEVDKANKALQDAREKVNDIYKEIEEKQKEVLKIQQELNEAMYGTGVRRKSTLDEMYNYDQLLKQLANDIADVTTRLTNYESTNILGDTSSYSQLMHEKKVTLLGSQRAYQNSLSTAKSLLGQYSAYYTEINGRLLVDVARLNSASMPDKIKNQIESTINAYNNSIDKIHDITNEIKSLENDFVDFQKTYRDRYINLQEKVISILKQQAEDELNIEKEKYTALEEADNEYINALEEAINKQRELRNLAREDEALAQKEKKLSLMQRDTSGANQKDILKQQQDVEKTRESLNDKKIDSIVKSLKELYKIQKQSRDAEVKYRETVLQNANFIEEANAVISSWQTADDLISWFMEHSAEVENMTQEQLKKYQEELAQMYADRETYMHTSMKSFTNMLNVSEDEINDMAASVSDTLSTEMDRAFQETREDVNKTINDLIEKLNDAKIAVTEAEEKLKEALEEIAKEVEEVKNATTALATARAELANATNEAAKAQERLNAALGTKPKTETSGENSSTTSHPNGYGLVNDSQGSSDNKDKKQTLEEYINYLSTKSSGTSESVKNRSADEIQKILEGLFTKNKNHGYYDPQYDCITIIEGEREDAQKIVNTKNNSWTTKKYGQYQFFAKGGLVNYTGPAWVDGTPAQPEAFLNAEDTKNIATFTNVLSNLLSLTPFRQNQSVDNSTTTTINVTVNVDSISDDYDVHNAVQKVKDEIVAAAQRVGSTVILHQ